MSAPEAIFIFQEEGQRPSPIKRHESLNDVVAADHRFVIRSGKFKDSFDPDFRGIAEGIEFEVRDVLQLEEGGGSKNRAENGFQFRDAVRKHFFQARTIHGDRFQGDFRLGADGGHGLTAGKRAPQLEIAIERRE